MTVEPRFRHRAASHAVHRAWKTRAPILARRGAVETARAIRLPREPANTCRDLLFGRMAASSFGLGRNGIMGKKFDGIAGWWASSRPVDAETANVIEKYLVYVLALGAVWG